MSNAYTGESSEEKAGIERSRIALRKQGSDEDLEIERNAAREVRAVRSLMERYGLDREEAEMMLDKLGGIGGYMKKFSGVEREEYDDNSRAAKALIPTIRGVATERERMIDAAKRAE